MPASPKPNYLIPFALVTTLFFLWGFIHNVDPILIPHLKRSFSLSTLESSLVDFSVYIAYFAMALPAGMLMRKYGYKAGIITGLLLFATGSFLFIPAANTQLYVFFLGALFIIACGLTILETAANPYASLLGDPKTGTLRLNFAQSFNGLAAATAPIIGDAVIRTNGFSDEELATMTAAARQAALASEASTVKTPYLVLGSFILVIAFLFALIKLPEIKEEETGRSERRNVFHALRHSHLRWAVIAQFFYVGAQVCVGSFFILYAAKAAGLDGKSAARYLGLGYGMAFMIGRFFGTFLMRYIKPEKLLALYSLINIGLCAAAMVCHGMLAIYVVIAIGFFMSIMFPTIFALGIKDLGADAKIGSSLIIMSIVGGAVLSLIFGRIADITGNIQTAYIVPLVCFVVTLVFGLKTHKVIAPKEVMAEPQL